MRAILAVHDYYASANPSGEALSFEAEVALLQAHGHEVVTYVRHNDEIDGYGWAARAALPVRTIWNSRSRREVAALLRAHRPAVAHFQNTFPLISPSAYAACRDAGVPVVQTVHNYRLLCPVATFYRRGRICEECLGRAVPWPGVLHACYRGSRAKSATVAAMLVAHRLLRTWSRQVDLFVTPSEFTRAKLVEGGFPADRIAVKPNFLFEDPGVRERVGEGAIYVGRLSEEKGLRSLLRAWARVRDVSLRIVGDGPMLAEVRALAAGRPGVEVLGRRTPAEVSALLKAAAFAVFPSEWYETFGRVTMEAFACGVPVVAARLGAMAEAVEDGRTGLLFSPGDAADLAARVEWARDHAEATAEMGRAARAAYEARYTADRNYTALSGIYDRAAAAHGG
jgi:glycosyltransferase involved in cell wall biosynthesis